MPIAIQQRESSLEPDSDGELRLRQPTAADGGHVHALIKRCPPLDENSHYCNLLQCLHFASTSALAERNGAVVGFVSGYRPPDTPDTLFIWQVAVDPAARGLGLGQRLMLDILSRPENADITKLNTTVTQDNAASWAMFENLAAALDAPHQRSLLFDRDIHFGGHHDSEFLMAIGPFGAARPAPKQ